MPSIQQYYVDGRVFKSGKRNPFLNLSDSKHLNDIISQVIYGSAPGATLGPLLHRNGLTEIPSATNFIVELGGSLLRDTSLLGSLTHSFTFDDLNGFTVNSTNTAITASNTFNAFSTVSSTVNSDGKTRISGETQLEIGTPIQNSSPGSLSNGYILTLTDFNTGLCEWQANAAIPPVAENGLYVNVNNVRLGGPLIEDTVVDGATLLYDLEFNDIKFLGGTGTDCTLNFTNSTILRSAGTVTLDADTTLQIQTPGLGVASNGDVLSLVNNLTGESEWTTLPAFVTDNIYIADGTLTGNRILGGGSNSLTFQTLSGFTLSNAGAVLVDSSTSFNVTNTTSSLIQVTGDAIIRPTTSLQLDTPLRALGTNDLSVLTLKNNLTGEAEWVDVDTIIPSSFDTNIYKNDGSLTGNRVVTGATFDLAFTGIGTLGINSNTLFDINSTTLDIDSTTVTIDGTNITTTGVTTSTTTSPTTTIEGTTELRVKTAALASATNGESLLLVDKTTGEVEYGTPTVDSSSVTRYSDTFVIADWTSNNLAYTAATHGRGTNPIVQAYEEVSAGVYVQVHGGVPLPGGGGNMLSIQINSVGDVVISTVLAGGVFDGKIIIM